MSAFASTWEIERGLERGWPHNEDNGEEDDEVSTVEQPCGEEGLEERSSYAGSSGSDVQQPANSKVSVGFFQGMFR